MQLHEDFWPVPCLLVCSTPVNARPHRAYLAVVFCLKFEKAVPKIVARLWARRVESLLDFCANVSGDKRRRPRLGWDKPTGTWDKPTGTWDKPTGRTGTGLEQRWTGTEQGQPDGWDRVATAMRWDSTLGQRCNSDELGQHSGTWLGHGWDKFGTKAGTSFGQGLGQSWDKIWAKSGTWMGLHSGTSLGQGWDMGHGWEHGTWLGHAMAGTTIADNLGQSLRQHHGTRLGHGWDILGQTEKMGQSKRLPRARATWWSAFTCAQHFRRSPVSCVVATGPCAVSLAVSWRSRCVRPGRCP